MGESCESFFARQRPQCDYAFYLARPEGQTRGISASVIPDNYDPSERRAEGWEQVHKNLLVKGVSS